MLTIAQMTDSAEIRLLAGKAGVSPTDKLCCFAAKQKGELLGFCLYTVSEKALILAVECGSDGPLFDGLIRAVFSCLSQKGTKQAEFGKAVDRELLRQYRFITEENEAVPSMGDFLEQCKNCKNP